MNKTIVSVVGILAVTCLIGLYIWTSNNRYSLMTGSRGIAYEVDRKTGVSWMLYGARKVLQHGNTVDHSKEQQLPYEAVKKSLVMLAYTLGIFLGSYTMVATGLLPESSSTSPHKKRTGLFAGHVTFQYL